MKRSSTIPAEPFDIMQYYYRCAHDPLIRCKITLDGHVDTERLCNAVELSLHYVPEIGCCYEPENNRWTRREFTREDLVKIHKDSDIPEVGDRLLLSTIDIFREPQLKIMILRKPVGDTLYLIINHMICDGAGFKQYLYLVCDLYNQSPEQAVQPQDVSKTRSMLPLLSSMTMKQKLSLFRDKTSVSPEPMQLSLPLTGDENSPFIVTKSISKEQLSQIRLRAKENQATLNDMLLTAYVRGLRELAEGEHISIPCPVDLRKYISQDNQPRLGICNLTSNYYVGVTIAKNECFEETLRKVSKQMSKQKQSLTCVKGPMLLNLVYHILPRRIMQRLFFKLFTIPVVSYTNLGVIDSSRLSFEGAIVRDCYMSGAIKHVPYFQISFSSYDGMGTISCNLYGTDEDYRWIESFLKELIHELISL